MELGLSELISFCKKWYIRDELCGLTKKKKLATVIVGLFSLKENAPTKNKDNSSTFGARSKPGERDKTGDFKQDKTADFQNRTKQPIFKIGQNSRF